MPSETKIAAIRYTCPLCKRWHLDPVDEAAGSAELKEKVCLRHGAAEIPPIMVRSFVAADEGIKFFRSAEGPLSHTCDPGEPVERQPCEGCVTEALAAIEAEEGESRGNS
jgi:hypothetical protein